MEIARPCITYTTGMAKAKFETGFCIHKARELLCGLPYFDEIKISDRIGLLKTYGKITLMLFEDGSATIKPVSSSEEGYRIFGELGSLLVSAARCPIIGGNTVQSCDGSPCPEGCRYLKTGRIRIEDEKEGEQD
ncbi:MAG: hypothetical protein LWY06_17205 [Firmicutes bacterium]|nr:hypothetical protein [Bacillota bacterium]